MNIVIFGLSISSSWGNGHATLWRGLCEALAKRGCRVVFFERDAPYYAENRDLTEIPGGELLFYKEWSDIQTRAKTELTNADCALVTSYCPNGREAARLVLDSTARVKAFYDLDTPVTLDALHNGKTVDYLPENGLGDFDVVLSYTGGTALSALQTELGAKRVAPLYGSVNPDVHYPVPPDPQYVCDLSYLGTYAEDRQAALEMLFIEPARQKPDTKFVLGGAMYPDSFPWTQNMYFVRHLPPREHPAFFASSRFTVNVTRRAMAQMGYCPSGRLFEAAACGTPVLSDVWEGLEQFYTPGDEILCACTTEEALQVLEMSDEERNQIARNARERTLSEHTATHRADELLQILQGT